MKIHHTAGVYSNDSFKTNGVSEEFLAGHTEYNLTMRPGRGFFVDGKCVHKGYLTDEQVAKFEEKFKDSKATRDTQPYQ